MSRSQQRVCRLCEFPAADSGVPVDAIDAQKLAEWCKQKLGTELEIATDAVICQFCIWDARFDNENSLGDCHVNVPKYDWWTGNDNDHIYQQYFYKKPIIQPCRVQLKKTLRTVNNAFGQNISEIYPREFSNCDFSTEDKRRRRELQNCSAKNAAPASGLLSKVDHTKTTHIKDVNKCEHKFHTALLVNEELKQVQNRTGSEVPCIYCGVKYPNQYKLKTHISGTHAAISIKCRLHRCTLYFLNQEESDKHFYNAHQLDESLKKYQCSKCSYKTNKKVNFQNHLRGVHVAIKKVICQKCGKGFKNKYSLKEHLKKIHQLSCTCENCGRTMLKSSLRRHFLEDLCKKVPSSSECKPEVLFKCEYDAWCPTTFRNNYSMKRHIMNIHKEIRKNVPCIYCGKVNSNEYSLATHIKNAHAKIRFKCRFHGCKQYFFSQTESDQHFSKVHKLEESLKKFQCSDCSYKTRYNSSLQTHNKRVHGPSGAEQCPKCGKEFKTRQSLKQHLKKFHRDAPERSTCKHCGTVMQKSSLYAHVLRGYCENKMTSQSALKR